MKLTRYIHSVVQDVAVGGVPWATSGGFVAEYLQRKASESRELMLDELAQGLVPVEAASQDDAIAIVLRIQRAYEAGCARAALRLLIAVLNGQGEQGPVYASEFTRFEKVLADLSREEIILLATILKHYGIPEPEDKARITADTLQRSVAADLVPRVFKTEHHMAAHWASAQRTGLLVSGATIDTVGRALPSPLLAELAELASFKDVLSREGEQV